MKKNRDSFGLLVLLLFGLGGSTLLGLSFDRLEQRAVEGVLIQQVQKKARAIEQGIHLNLETLYTLKGGLEVMGQIEEEPFRRLARSIISRHRDIQALEWIPRVPAEERDLFEQKLKARYPDFSFTEQTDTGLMTRAGERDLYFPVYFLEPQAGNELAFGFDLASNNTRYQALKQTTDRGQLQASASIRLVQDSAEQRGFLAFLPLYQGTPTTQEGRQAQLLGFVLGVFRIQDVIDSALSGINTDDVQLELWDRTEGTASGGDLLLRRASSSPLEMEAPIGYELSLTPFAGRQWVLTATASSRFISGNRSFLPLLVSVTGLLLTFLVVGFFYTLLRHSEAVEEQVELRTRELQQAKEKLEQLSTTDKLTGLANRHRFDRVFSHDWNRAGREQQALSLMMIDVDHFKRYNDCYGHVAGDECLATVATVIETLFKRSGDLVARYGGEEFVVILPNTSQLRELAQGCCRAVEALGIPHQQSGVAAVVTVSVGVSSIVPDADNDPRDLIEDADRALYEAKERGRNQMVIRSAVEVKC